MSVLKNPVVAGALAVAAVGALVYSVIGSRPRGRPHVARPAETFVTAPATPGHADPTNSPPPTRRRADLAAIRSGFDDWSLRPRRDPFLSIQPTTAAQNGPPPQPAAEVLRLEAVWHQTGARLAIVNRRLVREGDTIEEFVIVRIGADDVVVRGTRGPERVPFGGLPNLNTVPPRTQGVVGPQTASR